MTCEGPSIVLWDIDGTLVSGAPGRTNKHVEAVCAASGADASRFDQVHIGTNSGFTDWEILELLLEFTQSRGSSRAIQLAGAILDHLSRVEFLTLPPSPQQGAREALEEVNSLGWVNGLMTGNTSSRAMGKLGATGLDTLINWDFAFCSRPGQTRNGLACRSVSGIRDEFPGSKIVFVGDTPRDIEAAKQAKAPVVAVATGQFSVDDLRSHDPDLALSSLAGRGPLSYFLRGYG